MHCRRYKNPPVPRRLVGESQIPTNLSPAHTDPSNSLSGIGLASKQRQVRTGAQTDFQLRRLPVRSERGQGQTHPRVLGDPTDKNKRPHDRSVVPSPGRSCPY